ncbi:serine hydrolase [Paenibacillus sp. 22594]|uniref:serine hydrolase n=1 Tax=Paenibacillus sp. 22594 TaxID=3453947 RepID=UPI003F85B9EA
MDIIIYIGCGIIVLLGLFALLVFFEVKRQNRRTEQHILKFIARNPSRASLYIIENGEIVVDLQSAVRRPLASVAKIIVLAEFAEQAASQQIDLDKKVPLASLNRFYIPDSDGSAHSEWLFDLEEKGLDLEKDITMLEVARGMIRYSSNANTDFLMETLGLDRINQKITDWGLKDHDALYPFSSAILMPTYLKDTLGVSMNKVASIMKGFTYAEYAAKSIEIFNLLRNDPEGKWIQQLNRRARARIKFQKIWSDKFPRSTVKEYAQLLKDIYEGDRLKEEARTLFQNLIKLEVPNPQFTMAAQKGGSSYTILTLAMYYEDLTGNKTEMALFIYDPAGGEQMWLEKKLVLFINQYFTNEQFKRQVIQACHPANGI